MTRDEFLMGIVLGLAISFLVVVPWLSERGMVPW